MENYILRYYYSLKNDLEQHENLKNIFERNSLSQINNPSPADYAKETGFYFNLIDASGKMAILAVKIPADENGWNNGWELLKTWEDGASLSFEDLMGKLTILVSANDNLPALLSAIAPLMPCRDKNTLFDSNGEVFRLPIDRRDKEAIYVYNPPGSQQVSVPLLNRKLPIIHGQIIYLYELNNVLRDRNCTITAEKENLEKELIRILHTKLVMNQPSLNTNEELERDIEGLATAYAKLVADRKLVGDGLKKLGSRLDDMERRLSNEPVFAVNSEEIGNILAPYYERRDELNQSYQDLILAENNYQAAIEVVQSKIQVMNSRTNISTQEQIRELLNINTEMQKKSLVYQYAAGLIEFIILAYYSYNLWSHLTHTAAEIIPSGTQFVLLMLFSGNTVLLTHYLAEYAQGDAHVRNRLIYTGITLLVILTIIFIGTAKALSTAATH